MAWLGHGRRTVHPGLPMGDNGGVITLTESFVGQAGISITWQCWLPETAPKAIIVVAHGFGEHIGRYANLVDALVPAGYAIYGPDHRGHGRSAGHRALIDKHEYLLDDLDSVFGIVAAKHPNTPVFLVGHSMGGNIALASALRNPDRLRGLVLSGPAVTNDGISQPLMLLARILGRFVPKLGVKQLSAAGVSRDPAVVAAYEADPLVFHGKIPAGTGAALIRTSAKFPEQLPSLMIPLLVVHGSEDQLVSVESGRAAHRLAGSIDKTLTVYDGLFHEVFNEPENARVLEDVKVWLDSHC